MVFVMIVFLTTFLMKILADEYNLINGTRVMHLDRKIWYRIKYYFSLLNIDIDLLLFTFY